MRIAGVGHEKFVLDGYPTSPADYAQGQRNSPRNPETPGYYFWLSLDGIW